MLTFRKSVGRAIEPTLDRRGYRRSPITVPSYRLGKPAANKGQKFPPEPLTPEEIFELMVAAYRSSRICGRRNQALIVVGARAGLRCAEALALYPKDVDLKRGRIQVLHGKGDKSRVVAFDAGAAALLGQWLEQRAELGFDGGQRVFCVIEGPTRGYGLSAAYVRNEIKKWAADAGIEKRVHYHGLRHSYAAYLLDKGVPIHFIKRMLGHSSISITEHYADHISPSIVIEKVLEVDWPHLHYAA